MLFSNEEAESIVPIFFQEAQQIVPISLQASKHRGGGNAGFASKPDAPFRISKSSGDFTQQKCISFKENAKGCIRQVLTVGENRKGLPAFLTLASHLRQTQ